MLLAVMLTFILHCTVSVQAVQGTTYTYTISVDGKWIRTQEAYVPSSVFMEDMELNQPNDLFIKGDIFYIADTGNSRIISFNRSTGKTQIIGEGIFTSPSGVFVTENKIYVADSDGEALFILDITGNLIRKISRPENNPVMSVRSQFRPKNVAVSSQGNIFVVGDGAHEGIMQFEEDGSFQGYFAANKREISFLESVQEKFFTDEQKAQLLSRIPKAIHNIDISDRDLIYSVTQSDEVTANWAGAVTQEKTFNAVKLHNMAGLDILSPNKFMEDEWNFVDIAAGPYGNSYAVTNTGLIYEYDSTGEVVFSFGGASSNDDRYGLFSYAAAIDLDDNGFVYVLDRERGTVQCFIPTEFAVLTHEAVFGFENGEYEQSEKIWKQLLQLNGMSKIAHIGYGKCLYRGQNYTEAMSHFRQAGDKSNYSECFWEIRNQWINRHILVIIVTALGLIVLLSILSFRKRRKSPKKRQYLLTEKSDKLLFGVLEDLSFSITTLRHPIDNLYYLKQKQRGTILSATILTVLEYIAYLLNCYGRAFIFDNGKSVSVSLLMNSVMFFIPFGLFVLGNYMMASIGDGEGTISQIYIVTAYSLIPYMLSSSLAVALSYALTLNEGFIFTMISTVGIIWSAVLVFLSIMHIHNYTFKETVRSIVLTFLFILLMLAVAAILYMIWDKFIEFLTEFFSEVIYRAEN